MGKIDFLQLSLEIGFFFGLLVFRNFFAETAGVLAVESVFNGACQGSFLQVLRQHRCPRDRLKREPMRAGCR